LIAQQRQDIDSGWQGLAADAAKEATDPMRLISDKASQELVTAQNLHTGQAHAYGQIRNAVLKVPPNPGSASFVADLFPMFSDHADRVAEYHNATTHNIQQYKSYGGLSLQNGDGAPQDFGAKPRQYEGESSYTAAPNGSENSAISSPTFRQAVIPKVASDIHSSASQDGEVVQIPQQSRQPEPVNAPISVSTHDHGTVSQGVGAQNVTVPSGHSSIPAPGVSSGASLDFGPRGTAQNYGPQGQPVGGYPAGQWSGSEPGERVPSLGKNTGARLPVEEPAAPGRLSSLANAREGAGNPMMGSPAGAQGRNGEDREHKRASYLQEFDPESVFVGDLPMTTRPVIGE
jgi:hypothetical protein